MKYYFILIPCLFLVQCTIFNPEYYSTEDKKIISCEKILSPNKQRKGRSSSYNSGTCYAKCMIPQPPQNVQNVFHVYTGSDHDIEGIEYKSLLITEARSEWTKKKADKDCISADPEDCLVWCLVTTDEIRENIYVVTDTSVVKNYETKIIAYKMYPESQDFKWSAVVCDNNITTNLILQLNNALNDRGYKVELTDEFNEITKTALKQYQSDYGLPIGSLNYETLCHLEIPPEYFYFE